MPVKIEVDPPEPEVEATPEDPEIEAMLPGCTLSPEEYTRLFRERDEIVEHHQMEMRMGTLPVRHRARLTEITQKLLCHRFPRYARDHCRTLRDAVDSNVIQDILEVSSR